MTDSPARGHGTVTLPEMESGGVRVCVGTLLARCGPEHLPKPMYKRIDVDHATPAIACAIAIGQLGWYELMQQAGWISMIRNRRDLMECWDRNLLVSRDAKRSAAAAEKEPPIGVIISMEGTDPIVSPEQVQWWWDHGLRVAGLAHFGRGRYAYGTRSDGPLSPEGVELLKEFRRLGMIVDVTHMCDCSMARAMDLFDGPVLASHHNCRAIVPGDRQLSDEQIRRLISRRGVIGAAMDAAMIVPGYEKEKTAVKLADLVKHIDHVCQIAGNANHAAIGSDLDGGWGTEQTPEDLNTIADLQKLGEELARRGYADSDINGILGENWLRFFSAALPE